MTESVSPRLVEQPIDKKSPTVGSPTGETSHKMSLFPASDSFYFTTGRVDQRPSTQSERSLSKMKRTEVDSVEILEVRSALVTTDALPKNWIFGGNGMLFSIDRLFHRRS